MENVNIPILSYADTSVFGGVFDEGFDEASKAFFQQVREKRFKLVNSFLCRVGLPTISGGQAHPTDH